MIVILHWFFNFLPKGTRGITLFPWIILKDSDLAEDKVIINHEKIHIQQQLELGVILFYPVYILEFFYHFLKTQDRNQAYRLISFEREAYTHEHDQDYLKTRKHWGMWRKVN